MKIVVCDDDKAYLLWICQRIDEISEKYNLKIQIVCRAVAPDEVLAYMKKNREEKNLYLLDYELQDGVNGIQLASSIRKESLTSKIAFITSHGDRALEILKSGVEAMGFVTKTNNKNEMRAELAQVLLKAARFLNDSSESEKQFIELPIGIDEQIHLEINRIAYVETNKSIPHNICYHTLDGSEITVRGTVAASKEKLGVDFEYSHRSILVNKKCVIGYHSGYLKLTNGEEIICSFARKKFFL